MADNEEVSDSESQLITESIDGQLQIVEVRPFDKDVMLDGEVVSSLSDLEADGETKYVQLLNSGNKSMMQLDLLNLQLVKSDDGSETFRIVTTDCVSGDGDTVTCVLAGSDNETNEDTEDQEAYMVMQGEQGPIMLLQSSLPEAQPRIKPEIVPVSAVQMPKTVKEHSVTSIGRTPKLSPTEILERAKALQKAKALMKVPPPRQRGRKRKSDLPPPHELLSSPGFKLFLYSCKQCSFKCNAIKEMRTHRLAEHTGNSNSGGSGRWRPGPRSDKITLQCARCPYKGHTHMQLMKHVQDVHLANEVTNKVYLNTEEVEAADVLVCGACGFESASRPHFKRHIEKEHGATAV